MYAEPLFTTDNEAEEIDQTPPQPQLPSPVTTRELRFHIIGTPPPPSAAAFKFYSHEHQPFLGAAPGHATSGTPFASSTNSVRPSWANGTFHGSPKQQSSPAPPTRPFLTASGNGLGQERATKRFKFDETFQVLVGSGETTFTVHKDVIAHRSKFFSAERSGNATEQKPVLLPDVDANVFRSYLQWAYGDEVVIPAAIEDTQAGEQPQHSDDKLNLAKLYVSAQTLGDVKLRNATTDGFLAMSRAIERDKKPSISCIEFLWNNTPWESKMRRVALEWLFSGLPASTEVG
ncbi:BTB POZ domain containing [Lecanosticta acicola]|uniref:BTB POZ domain containing n=1 Tax=Lecanosticta acicola TaxID=111012 RepID=A0AAI8YT25_9PEZI|nr:BTB POZ domain containing [Lecanosticta acicola]